MAERIVSEISGGAPSGGGGLPGLGWRVGVIGGAVVWGGLLVMAGTVFLAGGSVLLGLAALAGGNWIFVVGGANRVFPGRVVRVSEVWEWIVAGIMGVAVVGWVAALSAGGLL